MFPTTIEEVEAEEKRQAEEAEEITPSLPTAEEMLEIIQQRILSTTRGAGVPCAVNTNP